MPYTEFSGLEVRPGEETAVSKLLMHAPVAVANHRATDPHAKANALLQVSGLTFITTDWA